MADRYQTGQRCGRQRRSRHRTGRGARRKCRVDFLTVRRTPPAGMPANPLLTGRPVRTCIGCRKRASSSELLRFVAIEIGPDQFRAVPDPARRRPGRGAHLHPDPACLALAERRRAFGRALRIAGVLDTGPLAEAVASAAVTEPEHTQ
ncbi:YlxR family protein [Dactylosporangium sp. NPDC000244]|uniref:YlxR family protein n=1 Tax=Dactylosporangium sp. NPDC000244 TaxID=3154365 RepID=UPI00332F3DA3